jgi:endo-1,3(4)-beta-glucanase
VSCELCDKTNTKYFIDYINPLGLDAIILSAAELESGAVLTTDSHEAFSVNANLAVSNGSQPLITFPLVQGTSFFTAIYKGASVIIKSSLFFKQISPVTQVGTSYRWIALLNDGHQWAIWIIPSSAGTAPGLTLSTDGSTLTGPAGFAGTIQVAKIENQGEETTYDTAVGTWAVTANISATANGTYSFAWTKAGDLTRSLLMFALPHHMETFAPNTYNATLNITLQTPSKGNATLISGDSWFLEEILPDTMGFAPWSPTVQNAPPLSSAAQSVINEVLSTELQEDMEAQTNIGSVYFAGKAYAKFASMVYVAANMTSSPLAAAALIRLENALAVFISNTANSTLTHDSDWGGVINSAGYTDASADFGNPSYNDHMFHYGYFVYTGAVLAALDPSWLTKGTNKAWINMLIRDYANPIDSDPYFPFQRNFDWFHGHSWASGLYASGDGNSKLV